MTRHALALAFLVVLGCGGDRAEAPPSGPVGGVPTPPPPPDPRRPTLVPSAGPPGTEVTASARDLVANVPVAIGFGTLAGHEIVERTRTGADGTLEVTVTVPETAAASDKFYLFLGNENDQPYAVSAPFLVTGADGSVRVRGRITDEGVECTAMRGSDDELYTLVGEVGAPAPGAAVTVEGTVAEVSTCQQGVTISVRTLRTDP